MFEFKLPVNNCLMQKINTKIKILDMYNFFLFLIFSYVPYPGGGEKWGGNGVGDDLYSFGFDGANLWTGLSQIIVLDIQYRIYMT